MLVLVLVTFVPAAFLLKRREPRYLLDGGQMEGPPPVAISNARAGSGR